MRELGGGRGTGDGTIRWHSRRQSSSNQTDSHTWVHPAVWGHVETQWDGGKDTERERERPIHSQKALPRRLMKWRAGGERDYWEGVCVCVCKEKKMDHSYDSRPYARVCYSIISNALVKKKKRQGNSLPSLVIQSLIRIHPRTGFQLS